METTARPVAVVTGAAQGIGRKVAEVLAEELGPSLRWATARPEGASRSTGA